MSLLGFCRDSPRRSVGRVSPVPLRAGCRYPVRLEGDGVHAAPYPRFRRGKACGGGGAGPARSHAGRRGRAAAGAAGSGAGGGRRRRCCHGEGPGGGAGEAAGEGGVVDAVTATSTRARGSAALPHSPTP